jgi:PEP-CTERM motif-containing protein
MTALATRAKHLFLTAILSAGALASAPALGLSVNVSPASPGVTWGDGANCSVCPQVLVLTGNAPVLSGSVGFANNLTLPTEILSLSAVGANPIFGGLTSGGTTTVNFSAVSYSVSGVSASNVYLGGGQYQVTQVGAATGTVTGSYNALDAFNNSTSNGPFSLSVDVSGLQCLVDAAGIGSCTAMFGSTGFVLPMSGELIEFRHHLELTTVPEPATGVLVLGGLVGLALARRRRGA